MHLSRAIVAISLVLVCSVAAEDIPLHSDEIRLPSGWLRVAPPTNAFAFGTARTSTYRNEAGTIWVIVRTTKEKPDQPFFSEEQWRTLEEGVHRGSPYSIMISATRIPIIVLPDLNTLVTLILTTEGRQDAEEILRWLHPPEGAAFETGLSRAKEFVFALLDAGAESGPRD